MKEFMNNKYIGLIFGILSTLLVYVVSIVSGETLNVWAFSGIMGAIVVAIKEVVNAFMIEDSKFNMEVCGYGLMGSIFTGVLLAFI